MGKPDYDYVKLSEVADSSKPEFNVYGVVTDVTVKRTYDKNNIEQDEYRLKISDGAMSIDVTVFAAPGKIPDTAITRGKIIRLHRLNKNKLKDGGFYLGGRVAGRVSMLLFDIPSKKSRARFNPSYRSSVDYSFTNKDDEILADLVSKIDQILAPVPACNSPTRTSTSRSIRRVSPQTPISSRTPSKTSALRRSPRLQNKSPQKNTAPALALAADDVTHVSPRVDIVSNNVPSSSGPTTFVRPRKDMQAASSSRTIHTNDKHNVITQIKDMEPGYGSYYNVLCQVVSCYSGKGATVLCVWDATRNHQIISSIKNAGMMLLYGDKNRENAIRSVNKLYEVICYDEHMRAADNLSAGDYIVMVNVHFYVAKTHYKFPSLVMHGGEGQIRDGNSLVSAGRRILPVTRNSLPLLYEAIDTAVKAAEPPAVALATDKEWNDLLSIPSSSPRKAVIPSPLPPNSPVKSASHKETDIACLTLARSASIPSPPLVFSDSIAPGSSQPSTSSSLQIISSPPKAAPVSKVFARRPPVMAIPPTPAPDLNNSPKTKKQRIEDSTQQDDDISTQALLDRIRPSSALRTEPEEDFANVNDTDVELYWIDLYNVDF